MQCPPSLKTTQSLQEKVKGWDVFVSDLNAAHHLNQITFYDQHPKEHASLAPDNEDSKENKLSWTFNNNSIWLACGYSQTTVQLIQKLPAGMKHCTVRYAEHFSQVIAVDCI
jgi:hypothetical protein